MADEIERKFLVDHALWDNLQKPECKLIRQGYLSSNINSTIRIRFYDDTAFLTIKGKSKGISRKEFEYEIPHEDAVSMYETMVSESITKTRFEIVHEGKTWEVDVFDGNNSGLIVAEIELDSVEETFEKPVWCLEEVSNDPRYYNSNLISNPYWKWKNV